MEISLYQTNSGSIVSPSKSDLSISENNTILNPVDFSFDCPKHDTSQSYSVIFAIDLSNSVIQSKKNLITSIINTFLNTYDLTKGEVAIIGFNENNFLLHDFSSDKQSLLKYMDNLSIFSYTNFDAAFINPTFGALKLSKSAKNKCRIILINDGSAPISKNIIINEALSQDIKISNVTLTTQTSFSISEITQQTGGIDFSNVSDIENTANIGVVLALFSQGFQPCKLTWNSKTCSTNNNLKVIYQSSQTGQYNFNIDANKLPYLEIKPFSSIDFGFVNPTATSLSQIKLIPRNSDIKISSIMDNPIFKLSGIANNQILRKDTEYNIIITFKPVDSNYTYFEIKLITELCDDIVIRVSGGKESNTDILHNLKVISPNGGEVFVYGQTYKIKWDGVLATDTVSIEYSTNNGVSWNKITDKAVGLEYEWNSLPSNTNSNQCLLKVKQISKNSMSHKIIRLLGLQGEVVGIKWKKDNSQILTGSTDGFIRFWDSKSGVPIKTVYGAGIEDMKFLKMLDISSDEKTIAYVSKYDDLIIFIDVQSGYELDTIKLPNKYCTSINWNPSGNLFCAGTDDGTIYFWDYPNKIPSRIISAGSSIRTLAWSKNGEFLAAGLYDGNIKIYYINGDSITTIKNSDVPITSISWNKSNKTIAISSLIENINIWDITNPDFKKTFFESNKPVNLVEWDPSAFYIATASADSSIKLWDYNGNFVYKFGFHNNIVKSMKWSFDGKYIASGTIQNEVFIWSPDDINNNDIIQQDTSDNVWSIVNPSIIVKDVHFTQKYINRNVDTTVISFLTNTSTCGIIIDSVQIYGDTKQVFSVDNSIFPLQINANASIDLKFGFNPPTLNFNIDSIIVFNGLNITKKIISGIGVLPVIQISPQSIDFGIVNLGDSATIDTVVIENLSDQEVNIQFPDITGSWKSNFTFLDYDFTPLAPNEKRYLKIRYKPTKIGSVSAITNFEFPDLIDSERLILNGSSVAPQIDFIKSVEIPVQLCDNTKSELICKIKNTGDAVLKIDSIKMADKSNKGFNLNITGMSNSILPDETTYFTITFESEEISPKWAFIEIYTNFNADGTTKNEVLVNAKRESVKLLQSQNNINFFVDIDETQQKSFYIVNTGTVPIRCDTLTSIKQFELISINPKITLPGDTSEIIINFPGSSEAGSVSEQLKLKDTCNNIYVIDLNAYIGLKNAKISVPDFVNFKELVCKDTSETIKIYISNTGTSPLIIDKIKIEGLDFNDFVISKDITNNIILPDKKDSIEIIFTPKLNSTGQKKTYINIYSNASNLILGKTEIELNAFKGFYDFSFSVDTLLFNNAYERIKYFADFDIINEGNLPLNWSMPQNLTYFVIDSIKPETIYIGQKSKVYVKFNGASPTGIYDDIIKLQTICGLEKQIVLRANITAKANAGLRVGNMKAASGDSLKLPIYLFSPANIDLPDVVGYKTTISFNATLLVPTSDDKGRIIDGIRYLDLEFPGPIKQEGQIGSINVIASLGNCDSTLINLTNSSAINDNQIKIEEEGGVFYLDSVCYKGGPRLIGGVDSLKLYQNEPNPANEAAKFKFSIIEKGRYSLELYDLNGRFTKLLFKGNLNPGQFEIIISLKDFAVGNYIYVLQTPQTKLYKKLTINR